MNKFFGKAVEKDGQYSIVATTADVDRDGEVVEPGGVTNLDRYLKDNPVVLFGHKWDQPPVGKATAARQFDDRIELDIQFADTEFGREIRYLYDNGFMSSFSIGFIPHESEIKSAGRRHWTNWEMLEVSAVPIPSNSFANIIRTAEKEGFNLAYVKGMYEGAIPESPEDMEGNAVAPEVRQDETQGDSMAEDKMKELESRIDELQGALADKMAAEEKAVSDAREKELEDLKAQLVKVREEGENKLADLKAQMKMGQFPDDAKVEIGNGHKGLNLDMAAKDFGRRLALKGHPAAAERAEKSAQPLIAKFHDLYLKSIDGPRYKDATVVEGTPTAGGHLTPDQRAELIGYARLNSVALRRADVIPMASDSYKIPIENAKVSLAFSNEATAATETSATFTEGSLSTTDLDGWVDVSSHLEMDSTTPIAALLLDQFTESFGQMIDSAVFSGTGDPVSGVFLGYGRSEVFSTGSSNFSELLVTNLVNAVGQLEAPRRQGAAWFGLRSSIWNYVNNLTEDSKHVLVPAWGQSANASILGYPVEETEYAPANAASTAMLVFGNLNGFKIGERLDQLTLFRDPYTLSTYHHVRYVFWTRVAFLNALPNNFVGVVTAA